MERSSATWVRLGIIGMVVSFIANMVLADPLPDPVAIVCFTVFAISFLLLIAGTVRTVRSKDEA